MARNPKATRKLGLRYLIAASALIAGFALDGPARCAWGLVVNSVPGWPLRLLAYAGDLATLTAVVAALFVCGLVVRRSRITRAAAVLALALVATGLVVLSLKWTASRSSDGVFYGFGAGERGNLFPSGHTALAFAACTVIGLVWRKAKWPVIAVAAGVAISRAMLIHFLSDVVAGALIGVLVGQLVTAWAAKKGFLELDAEPHTAAAPEPDWAPPKR